MSQKIYSDLDVKGSVTISTINSATTDTDKFLVSDGGVVKYRTGAEMLSDLGVAPGVASNIQHQVKAGVAINKGQAVYVTGADGTNMIVGLASNATEATSSKTMGLMTSTVAINDFGNVVTEGLLAGLNTLGATAGDPVWLGTGGNLIYGLINKPYAPAHLVFIGIVTRVNLNNGEIFVKAQNGFELNEIHDVDLKTTTPVNGHILGFNGTLWVNKTIAGWLGYTPANDSNVVHKTFDETIDGNKIFIKDLEVNNIVVGIGAGFVSTNTAVGREALSFNSSGYRNTAIGSRNLRNNTTGFFNTAVGSNALHENISGGENTAIGMQALFKNTTGYYNTAVGVNTLRDNINGSYNTTLGSYTLSDNTSGSFNTAIGPYASHRNVTGNYNIAIGYESLRQNNGGSNIAVGTQTLYNNSIGYANVALGQSALFNNQTGINNLALGQFSLFNNKSGGNNIGIGQFSLVNLKLGSDNIGIGASTNLLDKSDSNSIIIGNGATGIGSNRIVLGSPSTIQTFIRGRVTLGTTADNGVDILQASGYTLATGYKIPGGQSNWFLKANGSYDTTTYQTALTNPVTGSGTQNYITKFTTNGSPIGDSQIFDNGINVGIGVGSSPLFKLHTLNNLNSSAENWIVNIQNNNNEVNTPTAGIRFNVGDSVSNKAGIIFRRTAGFGVGDLYFLNNGAIDNTSPTIANNTAMVIKSSGNVGIGTTTTTEKLTVSGYTLSTGYRIPSGSSTWFLKADGSYDTNTYTLASENNWTKTADDIQNNNIGNVKVKLEPGKKLQFLNSASTLVGSINENGVGTYGNSVDYTTVGPLGGNSWIGMNRSQASALFTLGNPQITQAFSLISTNYFGSSYVAGSNEASASAGAEHSFNIGNSVGNGITSGIFRISRTRLQSTVPVKYASDLSASYDDRTLVDKGYITTSLSTYSLDSNVVHKTGDETIDGNKIFIKDLEVNNMVVGIGSGFISTNTAIGRNALLLNTTGLKNTAIGSRTLSDNTTGFFNTAVGSNALNKNTSGTENTAIGMQALFQSTTGSFNTAVGTNTLRDNIDGSGNTSLGALTLSDNTSGGLNVAIGYYAMHNNITGTTNVGIGYQALKQNNATGNVAVGSQAVYNNEIGNNNIGIGSSALFDNKTGSSNIAIGASALYNCRFGTNNIGIGQSSGLLLKSDTNSIVIGVGATGIGSNKTVLGSPSTIQTFIRGRVTLNTTSDNGVDLLQANGYISATGYKTPGGSSSQYLMANGTTSTAKYKVYTAILSQSGTNPPVPTVLENTIGSIVWTRNNAGAYAATLAGAFPLATYTVGSPTHPNFGRFVSLYRANSDIILLRVADPLDISADNLGDIHIEIRVY